MNTYTTAAEAINNEILAALPADAELAYDLDAIADEVLTTTGEGVDYRFQLREGLDETQFWAIVEANAYTYTARITEYADPQPRDDDYTDTIHLDTITIYRDGEEYDVVQVETSEDPEPYDDAVRDILATVPFDWED